MTDRPNPSETYDDAVAKLDGRHRDDALPVLREIGRPEAIDELFRVLVERFEKPTGDRMWTFVEGAWQTIADLWDDDYADTLYETLRQLPRHFRGWRTTRPILSVVAQVDQPWAPDFLRLYERMLLSSSHTDEFAALLEENDRDPDREASGDDLFLSVRVDAEETTKYTDEPVPAGLKASLLFRPILRSSPDKYLTARAGDALVRLTWEPREGELRLFAELPDVVEGRERGVYTGSIDADEADRALTDLAESRAQPDWLLDQLTVEETSSGSNRPQMPRSPDLSPRHTPDEATADASSPRPEETPDDLDELEPMASRDATSVAPEDHARLARSYWERATDEDDFRERRSLLKRTAFFIRHAVDHGFADPDELQQYLSMLEVAAEVHFDTAPLRRAQALIRVRLAEARGALGDDPLRDRVAGEVRIDSGTFGLGDIGAIPNDEGPRNEEKRLTWAREGTCLSFTTGDGVFPVELRLVDGPVPRLTDSELARMERCTAQIVIETSSGHLALGDLAILATDDPSDTGSDWRLDLAIGNGGFLESLASIVGDGSHLAACVYALPDRIVGVVCHTDDSPPNDVRSLEEM